MTKTNLYYLFLGIKATKRLEKEVNIKPTKDNLIKVCRRRHGLRKYNIPVHYCPDINKQGIMFGGATCSLLGKHYIFVDDNFMNLDYSIKRVIIEHEIGHCILGHIKDGFIRTIIKQLIFIGKQTSGNLTDIDIARSAVLNNRNSAKELEADNFAAKRYGNKAVSDAIVTMINKIQFATQELKARYKALTGEEYQDSF